MNEEIEIHEVELLKFHQDVYAVRVNGRLIVNTRDPQINTFISPDDHLEVAANGCLPQAAAQGLFDATKAKKMRQEIVSGEPTIIRTA